MSNNLTVFQNEQFGQVRTIDEKGKVYFCGKDVAEALGYSRARDAIKDHCLAKGAVKRRTLTGGGNQTLVFIDEGNLYRLITHSKLPEAEKFEAWVFDEVLPTIRKTGKFEAHKATDDLKAQRVATAKKNADIRSAKLLLQIADSTKTQYKEVLQAHATKLITGEFLLPASRSFRAYIFGRRDCRHAWGKREQDRTACKQKRHENRLLWQVVLR